MNSVDNMKKHIFTFELFHLFFNYNKVIEKQFYSDAQMIFQNKIYI